MQETTLFFFKKYADVCVYHFFLVILRGNL